MVQINASLWFLQIADDTTSSDADKNPVIEAFKQVCRLFKDENLNIQDHSLSSLDLDKLLEHLDKPPEYPLWVLGTVSQKKAIAYSWQELGLNLFDLPWYNDTKVFHYLSISTVITDLATVLKEQRELEKKQIKPDYKRALDHLKWAKCHQFAQNIQKAVGHGIRDRFQSEKWEQICRSVNSVKNNSRYDDLSCSVLQSCSIGESCQLKHRINELLSLSDNSDEQERLKLAQQVADLDCRIYRLAPAQYFPLSRSIEDEIPKFKRIVIIEDNTDFRTHLKEALKRFIIDGENLDMAIIDADIKKSYQKFCLSYSSEKENNKDILDDLINNKTTPIHPSEILTCFDLDLGKDLDLVKNDSSKSGMKEFMKDIFSGHWIMYATASQYPNVPRMIVTGFRSQDLLGYSAGSGAYLLKPFTTETLTEQIKHASVIHRVKWICPEKVQQDYDQQWGKPIFAHCRHLLTFMLQQQRIELEVIEKAKIKAIAASDLIILDLFTHKGTKVKNILKIIKKIYNYNSHVKIILVVPTDHHQEYRNIPLHLRSGDDAILKKPTWIIGEGHPNPEDSLGSLIIQQLKRFNDYDIKYQVIVPVPAIIGRCEDFIPNVNAHQCSEKIDNFYAPLIPYLVDAYGLSASLKTLAELAESEPEKSEPEKLQSAIEKKLIDKLEAKQKVDSERWEKITEDDIKDVSKMLISDINHPLIQGHINLEAWLRSSVEHKVNDTLEDVNTLTEPLTRVFGGVTRYEFTVRGGWYKGTERIDDILIVIEFCAKSSLIARDFIKTTVVKYLRKIAKEDCVLVQEIPIRGYLL